MLYAAKEIYSCFFSLFFFFFWFDDGGHVGFFSIFIIFPFRKNLFGKLQQMHGFSGYPVEFSYN